MDEVLCVPVRPIDVGDGFRPYPMMTFCPALARNAGLASGSGSSIGSRPRRASDTAVAPLVPRTSTGTRFIDGEPMKSATKMLAGLL
jgi:hypothetical protein